MTYINSCRFPFLVCHPQEEEEEAEPKREKTSFTVKLIEFDAGKKVQLIKEIKSVVEGLNLVQVRIVLIHLISFQIYSY